MLASQQLPSNVALEDVSCPMGCAREDEIVVASRDRISGIGGSFSVVRCRSCGLSRTNPRPTRETIGAYYPDAYAPYQYTKAVVASRAPRSLARRLGRRLIQFNSDRLPTLKPGHLLEIGCASGSYLAHLASQGWTAEGVELNETAAACARQRGFRVQNCAVEVMQPPTKPVSLVIAWMVLEHLHDPIGALQRFHEWSEPGAALVASVPNFAAFGSSAFGAEWYPLQLPCHLFHYDEQSMRSLLARGGWRLDRVLYHRTLNDYLASVGNMVETRGQSPAAERIRAIGKKRQFHLAMYPLATAIAALGQTGRMTIWATRA
jgi:2-polyprenyl-3-methyl-5-hydroxy-6-metoxy-1,4-benzoquinol methylase